VRRDLGRGLATAAVRALNGRGVMEDSERLTRKEITVDCGEFWQSNFPVGKMVNTVNMGQFKGFFFLLLICV